MITSARDGNLPLQSKRAPERQATTLNSTDAMAMVEHGSEVTLNVTTPVGTKFITTSTFVGCHSNNTALIEVPNISDEDLKFYFQEGFWINVKRILIVAKAQSFLLGLSFNIAWATLIPF